MAAHLGLTLHTSYLTGMKIQQHKWSSLHKESSHTFKSWTIWSDSFVKSKNTSHTKQCVDASENTLVLLHLISLTSCHVEETQNRTCAPQKEEEERRITKEQEVLILEIWFHVGSLANTRERHAKPNTTQQNHSISGSEEGPKVRDGQETRL